MYPFQGSQKGAKNFLGRRSCRLFAASPFSGLRKSQRLAREIFGKKEAPTSMQRVCTRFPPQGLPKRCEELFGKKELPPFCGLPFSGLPKIAAGLPARFLGKRRRRRQCKEFALARTLAKHVVRRRGCGGRIRTCDLRVMSPTSYRTAPPRDMGIRKDAILFYSKRAALSTVFGGRSEVFSSLSGKICRQHPLFAPPHPREPARGHALPIKYLTESAPMFYNR